MDSAVVICEAMDPDADTLVYDWLTSGSVRLQTPLGRDVEETNTYPNFQVVYPDTTAIHNPIDTAWVQCSARDRRGKSATMLVYLTIHK